MTSFSAQFANNISSSIKQSCVLCGDSGHQDLCLCQNCLNELPFIENGCDSCGVPLSSGVEKCGACISTPPSNTICISLLNYQEPVDYLIKHMKYHNQLSIAELMGKLLVEKINQAGQPIPEQIIPVPLHFSRLQQRGYNQASEIARSISRAFNIPINLTDCHRKRNTTPQYDLPSNLRSDNLKEAFEVINEIPAKHVAIVDDVMTTGATVWELSRAIIDSGVERVDIWTCSRATTN